ncbi:MAG: GNAT family N-acetyltransferase [Oscillospiraceae bacterium]|nr:GNAT family N-acetyltransferase [Oscillospiraceae bacterium]
MNLGETWIVPRLQRHEEAISRWRYGGEYAFYNRREPFRAECPDQPVEENLFVWLDSAGEVLGHVSYGPDGQIPTVEGYAYSKDALDIGLGLRPDLCGRGLGAAFTALCLRFARERYGASRFRLSVAAFNERAIKVYQKAGFSIEREVTNSFVHHKFYIMTGVLAGS